MYTAKVTTPKALQEGSKDGVGNQSFRVLYYWSASAGSVPFMWESQPGTPKHALTESSLPPLTPPPSYHQFSQKYNSSRQLINHQRSKRSGFLRTVFLASSRKRNISAAAPSSFSSSSVSSSSSSSSHLHSSKSTPMSKTEVRRMMSSVKFGFEEDCYCGGEQEHGGDGGSPTSTLCLGGGFRKSYRIKKMKKAMLSFVSHGKA